MHFNYVICLLHKNEMGAVHLDIRYLINTDIFTLWENGKQLLGHINYFIQVRNWNVLISKSLFHPGVRTTVDLTTNRLCFRGLAPIFLFVCLNLCSDFSTLTEHLKLFLHYQPHSSIYTHIHPTFHSMPLSGFYLLHTLANSSGCIRAIWGSVVCPRTLWNVDWRSQGSNHWPFWLVDDSLYFLSRRRPNSLAMYYIFIYFYIITELCNC